MSCSFIETRVLAMAQIEQVKWSYVSDERVRVHVHSDLDIHVYMYIYIYISCFSDQV